MKPIKLVCISLFSALLNLACSNESTSSTNSDQITDTVLTNLVNNYPPLHDTSYSIKKTFVVDTTLPVFDFFNKLGAVKVNYSNERIDWCARFKKYTLFDKNNQHIITFGIEGYNLFAAKCEFDTIGELQEQYKVFNKSYHSYDKVECFYKSDSLLLQTIIPLLERDWIGGN